jgi:uncharacterized protein (TIRG00374 family)
LRKNFKFILLFLFAVFILWFFGRNLNWSEVSQSLQKARAVYVTSAVLIICFGYLLRAKRWQVLLSPITETSLKELFATTTVGFAAMFFIGRMGEMVRPMWLPMRDNRVRPSAALVTLGLERVLDLAALITLFALNLLWFQPPQSSNGTDFNYIKTVGILMLFGVFVGIISLIIYSKISSKIIAWLETKNLFSSRLKRIIISIFKQLANALEILKDWKELLEVIFWTFSLWLAIAIPTWLVLLAFDLPLSFSDSLFILGFASVSSVVPTPGGAAGAFHTATAASLIFMNVNQELAVATAIVMHLVYFAPAVIFGFYYFFKGDISIERLKNLLSAEEVEIELTKG